MKRFLLRYFRTLLLLEAPLLLIFLLLTYEWIIDFDPEIIELYTQLFFTYPTYYPYLTPFDDGYMVDDWIREGVRVFLQFFFVALYTWKKKQVTKILLIAWEIVYYIIILLRFLVFIII